MKPTLSVSLDRDTLAAVRSVARRLGFTIPSGRKAGEGSVRQLLQHIASGEVLILCHNYDFPEDMIRDASSLRLLALQQEREGNLSIAGVMRGLASALDEAAKLLDN